MAIKAWALERIRSLSEFESSATLVAPEALKEFDRFANWLEIREVNEEDRKLLTPAVWLAMDELRALVALAREFEKDAALEAIAPER
jgi:hypothetical protein